MQYERRKLESPGEAIKRMVDLAIGCGTILALLKSEGGDLFSVEFPVRGTVIAEHEPAIISTIAAAYRRHNEQHPSARMAAVQIAMLRGTWQETPQWSGKWHPI